MGYGKVLRYSGEMRWRKLCFDIDWAQNLLDGFDWTARIWDRQIQIVFVFASVIQGCQQKRKEIIFIFIIWLKKLKRKPWDKTIDHDCNHWRKMKLKVCTYKALLMQQFDSFSFLWLPSQTIDNIKRIDRKRTAISWETICIESVLCFVKLNCFFFGTINLSSEHVKHVGCNTNSILHLCILDTYFHLCDTVRSHSLHKV